MQEEKRAKFSWAHGIVTPVFMPVWHASLLLDSLQ
jgi:hypothetical protein